MTRRFPLAGLLRARELAEERAAAELAQANRARDEAATEVTRARSQLANLEFRDARLSSDAEAPDVSRSWSAAVAARASLAARVQELQTVLEVADRHAHGASGAWNQARTQASMIDRLRTRHEHEVAAEELRAEQVALDEAALRRASEEDR
ncbi:flagellar FliJ family protein [Demequina mangrovi]|uniref:Flagellar FliJ protein n=1 Tax=Demequina mangrovi TaxID=1043493 RepID=A0A1H6ZRU4_9MICO|nr:flagellar FliJ family protein [Demequina mangrovi]SEJ56189.1 flagellar export protein FliJ [Demequina mangrovi]